MLCSSGTRAERAAAAEERDRSGSVGVDARTVTLRRPASGLLRPGHADQAAPGRPGHAPAHPAEVPALY